MSAIGKKVFDDLYLHISAVDTLPSEVHRNLISSAFKAIPDDARVSINVIKLNVRSGRISMLEYSDIESTPFPVLLVSWVIEPNSDKPIYRTYQASLNPPILHRKELLVTENHPDRDAWCRITKEAEDIGLFENSRIIGFQKNWESQIANKGYAFKSGKFLPLGNLVDDFSEIEILENHITEDWHVYINSVDNHLTTLNECSELIDLMRVCRCPLIGL